MTSSPCPCGLPAAYDNCCGRHHAGEQATTAEALMRSRYSAYVRKLGDYLLATWHLSTRPDSIDFDATKWLGLTIKRHLPELSGDLPTGDSLRSQKKADIATVATSPQATVEFIARYKVGGRAHRLHETSRFVLADGRWFYLDGEIHS